MTETTDPLLRIERAVCEIGGQNKFLSEVADRWPRLAGATIADVLEMTGDYDMFLEVTEPFYAVHGDELPPLAGAVRAALHALIILGGELAVTRVLQLLSEAGYGPRTAGFDDAVHDRESAVASWPEPLRARYEAGYRAGDAARPEPRQQLEWVPAPQGGHTAAGETFAYLVVSSGRAVLLTRWTRDQDPASLDAMAEAITNLTEMSTPAAGRLAAEQFEAGRSYPPGGQAWSYTDVGALAVTAAPAQRGPAQHQLIPLDEAAAERLRRRAQMGDSGE